MSNTTMKKFVTVGLLTLLGTSAAHAQLVPSGNATIRDSLCVGNDCATNENFGFDTLRLKENNLRIHFDDTSSSGSFPNNDWRIQANDSNNGGQSYLAIQDATANTFPFRVVAGAGNHALYVNSSGNVGMGTATPVLEMHIVDGDSPSIRLDQDASSGFQTQVWDLAGNETNFFVRDVTNSSSLPFKIRPGAIDNALVIDAQGEVAVGAANADFPVHVIRSTGAAATLMSLQNNNNVKLRLSNTNTSTDWELQNQGASMAFSLDGSGQTEFRVDSSGDGFLAGTLTENSDRNAKTNIEALDAQSILNRVIDLPISQWQYKDKLGVNHIGPMAQDFYSAFQLGSTNTGIASIDTGGVALVSIQALNQRLEQKDQLIAELAVQLETLSAKLESMEQAEVRLTALENTLAELLVRQGESQAIYTSTK